MLSNGSEPLSSKASEPAPVSAAAPVRAEVQYAELVPDQYQQQPIPQATVIQVVHSQAVHVPFGPYPTRVVCQFCHTDVITTVFSRPSLSAHVWALGLCVFGCWPCCVVPYLMTDCQAHAHMCPNCGREVGLHEI